MSTAAPSVSAPKGGRRMSLAGSLGMDPAAASPSSGPPSSPTKGNRRMTLAGPPMDMPTPLPSPTKGGRRMSLAGGVAAPASVGRRSSSRRLSVAVDTVSTAHQAASAAQAGRRGSVSEALSDVVALSARSLRQGSVGLSSRTGTGRLTNRRYNSRVSKLVRVRFT